MHGYFSYKIFFLIGCNRKEENVLYVEPRGTSGFENTFNRHSDVSEALNISTDDR